MPRWSNLKTRASAIGICAVVAWVLLFSAGATIDTSGYRDVLDPSARSRSAEPGDSRAPRDAAQRVKWCDIGSNFFQATFFYTPINAAILAMLAALVGGCASNLIIDREQLKDLEQKGVYRPTELHDVLQRRLAYMAESPCVSMFRGFVVYLALLAGILVVADPFVKPNPSTYLKFVGTVSLIAFVMGYDPTRFSDLLNRIPLVGPAGTAPPQGEGQPAHQVITAEKNTLRIETTLPPPPNPEAPPPPAKRKDGKG